MEAAAEIDPVRVREIAMMLPPRATGLGQPIANREAWNKLAAEPAFQHFLRSAHQQLSTPPVKVSDELFLDFSRTGNRVRWQDAEFGRREEMSNFALAECLENQGKFLSRLEVDIKEICGEHTWVYPAHDGRLKNFHGTAVEIDLGSSHVAWKLGTIDYLLGEKLSAATRALIRENLQRRIFKPYRDMVEGRAPEIQWLRATHNWNAVCHAGVVGAALAAIDSAEERAWFIASAQHYLQNFLKGFGTDGYCSEGLSYWNYGFGHFVMLGETIRQATGGRIDFLSDPAARLPALFGQRAEILNAIYPSIADCHPGTEPDAQITAYLFRRGLNVAPCENAKEIFMRPSSDVSRAALFAFLPENFPRMANVSAAPSESPLRTWFAEAGVLIDRPASGAKIPFAVSLKGGNNAEHHNHNDVGSFIVVAGRSMLLVDPGSEVYTARTFGPHRYDSDVLSSFGHDVPVVAGQLQSPGPQARARVLRTDFSDAEDTLALDLSSAYAVKSLSKLERTFVYHRADAPSLTVRDEVEFKKPESFETALVTWGQWEKISANEFLITETKGAVRVKIDTGGIPFEIKSKKLEADVATPAKATRLGLRLKSPVTKASIVMTITPQAVREKKQ